MTREAGTERIELSVPPSVDGQIAHICRRALPYEACGALFGTVRNDRFWRIEKAVSLPNCFAGDRKFAFAIDPADLAAAVRKAQGMQHLGFFHSHPSGPPEPSASDIADAAPWPGYLHAIMSPEPRGGSRTRFYLSGVETWHALPQREPSHDD